jgi:hypothetical protein
VDQSALPSDPDALTYLAAVAAADGAPVEVGVAVAVDDFIRGCKADPSGTPGRSNWDAIKASCILCGARTLAGALVPLRDYGPELWDAPTPTIINSGGSSGAWDSATSTMRNDAAGGSTINPRFRFNIGMQAGSTYKVDGAFAGDTGSISSVRLAVAGGSNYVSYDTETGVLSGTLASAGDTIEFIFNGTLGPSSVTIESLSIREVIAAPTNVADGFVEGDYTRGGATPGLKGDGTSWLDSGRANDDDPQDDHHVAVYATINSYSGIKAYYGASLNAIGSGNAYDNGATLQGFRNRSDTAIIFAVTPTTGLVGTSRSSSSEYTARTAGTSALLSSNSQTPSSDTYGIFAINTSGSPGFIKNCKFAFYSIGEALDLEALENRVSALVTAIGAAV